MDGNQGCGDRAVCGTHLPSWAGLRVVTVPPGGERPFDAAEWRGALVLVEAGTIELDCLGGSRERFGHGDVLWLDGLPVRALRNPGQAPARLVAISRR